MGATITDKENTCGNRVVTARLFVMDAEKIHIWKRLLGVTTQQEAMHIIIHYYGKRHKMDKKDGVN